MEKKMSKKIVAIMQTGVKNSYSNKESKESESTTNATVATT